ELGAAHVSAHHLERRGRRSPGSALERELVALEDRGGLVSGPGGGQLQGPSLARPAPQGNAPAREAEVGRVEVNRLQADRLGRPGGDAFHDPGKLRKVEGGAGPQLDLALYRHRSGVGDAVAVSAFDRELL